MTEYIKTKELHKHLGYIINETTLEEDTSLSKNSEAIGKSVESPNSNNIVSTTTSILSIKVSIIKSPNKCIKSPKITTQRKQITRKRQKIKERIMLKRIQMLMMKQIIIY